MRLRSSWILLTLLLVALAGGCGGDRQDVLLADFEFQAKDAFTNSTRDSVPNHLHRFGEGFASLEKSGRWTLGEEAIIHLHVIGARVLLEIDCSTSPDLSEQGQAVNLSWNGYDLGTHTLAGGWQRFTVVGRVPPIAVEQGMNEVVLRPTLTLDSDKDPRSLGVLVRGVRLFAEQDVEEAAAWRAAAEASSQPEEAQ